MDLRNIYESDIKSRALDVEEEEFLDEVEEDGNGFSFEWELGAPKKFCSKLFVLIGSAATDVYKTCATSKLIIGVIKEESRPGNKVNVYSHDIKGNICFVICIEKISPKDVFSWTDVVIQNLCEKSSVVNVLLLEHISNYRGQNEEILESFARVIYTTNHHAELQFKQLEQPSMVEGLPAQLLIQAEVSDMQCVVCIIFSRDLYSYFFILDVLKKLGLEDIEKTGEKILQMKMLESQTSSHLYT